MKSLVRKLNIKNFKSLVLFYFSSSVKYNYLVFADDKRGRASKGFLIYFLSTSFPFSYFLILYSILSLCPIGRVAKELRGKFRLLTFSKYLFD